MRRHLRVLTLNCWNVSEPLTRTAAGVWNRRASCSRPLCATCSRATTSGWSPTSASDRPAGGRLEAEERGHLRRRLRAARSPRALHASLDVSPQAARLLHQAAEGALLARAQVARGLRAGKRHEPGPLPLQAPERPAHRLEPLPGSGLG